MRESVLRLTRIPVAELAPNVVVVGDPERARAVGERLEGAGVAFEEPRRGRARRLGGRRDGGGHATAALDAVITPPPTT